MANLVDTLEKTYAVKAPKRYRTFIENKEYEKHPRVEMSGYISGPYDLDFTDELLADVKELGMNAGIDDMDDVPWDEDFATWIPIASMSHPDVEEPKMFLVLDTENGTVSIFHQDGWTLCPVSKSFAAFIAGLPEATCRIGASEGDDD
jgi:hypothetical protein